MKYQIPLFPLPGAVLFPRTHLPLHVFEPRYRMMMEAVVAGEQRIAIANLREGYQSDYFGAPPVHRVMTAARLLYADKLLDGRWNILVEGIERVELVGEPQQEPFRIGLVSPIREGIEESERAEVFTLTRKLAALAESIGEKVGEEGRPLINLVNTHMHPAVVCDIIASRLVSDSYARQCLLDERNILRRLRLLSIQMQNLVIQLREKGTLIDHPAAAGDD